MRLTQEQAAVADARALFSESAGVSNIHEARILDLLDQLRDTTARAEQLEKDRDALAAACQKGVDIIESLIPESVGNDDADEVLGEMRAALQRAKGGA